MSASVIPFPARSPQIERGGASAAHGRSTTLHPVYYPCFDTVATGAASPHPGQLPDPAQGSLVGRPHDDRYRRLAGEAAWQRLPAIVRERFSRRSSPGSQVIYRGEVVSMKLSRCGWVLAQLARLAGGPLPYTSNAVGPCVVVVTEDAALGGYVWSRSYPCPGSFPQVVHSAKRFSGATGLEEYLGFGLFMSLTLHEVGGALVFRSAGYGLEVMGRRMGLPTWLWPGRCEVTHHAETDERFSFTLTLDHPRLGRLAHQVAFFQEA